MYLSAHLGRINSPSDANASPRSGIRYLSTQLHRLIAGMRRKRSAGIHPAFTHHQFGSLANLQLAYSCCSEVWRL